MIEFIDVYKKYKSKKRIVTASKKINISFPNRGMIFILGPSGSGKTTIFNLISGIIKPTKGTILYNGQDITKFSGKKTTEYRNNEIGFIYQDNNLLESLSVGENIKIALNLNGKDLSKEDIEQNLSKYGLEDVYDSFPSELSGGEAQRVAICRAVLKQSRFMLADEPTGSLDQKSATTVMDSLKEISKERLVIVVSHDTRLAEKYADRIIKISSGSIEEDKVIQKLDDSETKEYLNREKIVSHIPFGFRLKLSKNFFCARPIKLALSSIVLLISMVLVLGGLNLKSFNKEQAYKSTAEKYKVTYQYVDTRMSNIGLSNIENIHEDFPHAIPMFFNTYTIKNYENKTINAFQFSSVITQEEIGYYKFKLFGKIPSTSLEILLTKFMANQLGINETNYYKKTIKINQKDYKISGILDTNFDRILFKENYKFFIDWQERNYIENSTLNEEKFASENTLEHYKYKDYDSAVHIDTVNTYFWDTVYYANLSSINLPPHRPEETYRDVLSVENILFSIDVNRDKDTYDKLEKYNIEGDIHYPFDHSLDSMEELSKFYTSVVEVVLIIFLVLALVLLINFVSSSVHDKLKEIKILKILGATNLTIYLLFLSTIIVYIILCSFISLGLYDLFENFFNSVTVNQWKNVVPMLTFDFNNFLILLFSSLAIGVFVSYFSVKSIRKF